jgi:hypothetical protein
VGLLIFIVVLVLLFGGGGHYYNGGAYRTVVTLEREPAATTIDRSSENPNITVIRDASVLDKDLRRAYARRSNSTRTPAPKTCPTRNSTEP